MNKKVAIIPAAGRGQRMLSMTDNCPKSMLPVGNKPLIGHHLDSLIKHNIEDVYIVVGYKKEVLVNYVTAMYGSKLNIHFVEQKELLGLAHAIKVTMDEIPNEYDGLYIVLGDIIVQDNSIYEMIEHNKSFVAYKEVNDYSRWCLLQLNSNNEIIGFLDKPDEEPDEKNAVVGIYYYNNVEAFRNALNDVINENIRIKNEFQISSVMEKYINKYQQIIEGIKVKNWFDFGEIETYNESKKHFNLARCFNNIKYDDNKIIKTSHNYNKIQREILWYLTLPINLHKYTPRLLNYSLDDSNVYYELEYVNGTALQELFIYNYLSCENWNKILQLIDDLISNFKTESNFHSSNLYKFLYNNYIDRLEQIKQKCTENTQDLILDKYKYININGKDYYTLEYMKDYIQHKMQSLEYDCTKYSQVIHGDLVFSNIIYNIGDNQIKLVDPRGNFNNDIIYGDIRYDIAKLCQCIIGKYDFIVNDLTKHSYFKNQNGKYVVEYVVYNFNEACDITLMFLKMIEKYNCNLSDIYFITAIQFLTMIPLHSESESHQNLMYFKFVELINKAYELDNSKSE